MGKWMVREIRSGAVVERVKFYVGDNVKPRKGKEKKTTKRKQDQNEQNCTRNLARLLNCNFGRGDFLLQPTYAEAGLQRLLQTVEDKNDMNQVRQAAEKALSLFLRRLKRAAGELKAIWITSDMDGETGECVRIHHHVVVQGSKMQVDHGEISINGKQLDALWGYGRVDWKPVSGEADHTALAIYLIRQVRRLPDAKKYSCTRNLEKPQLVKEWTTTNAGVLQAAPGGYVVAAHVEPGQPQYIRYILPKKERAKQQQGDRRQEQDQEKKRKK